MQRHFFQLTLFFFGDYTNITAHNGIIRPIWARMDSGQISIWTAIINHSALANNQYEMDDNENLINNYPNPSSYESFFSFKLYKESPVTIKIYDTSGKEVYTLVDNKTYPMGKHVLSMKSNLLPVGDYLYVIKSSYYTKSKKMIVK